MAEIFTIAGIGEVLFDVLPEGKKLGGAPVNFTFHAQQLGLNAYPVSAVGRDDDGRKILDKLTQAELSAKYIQQVDFPTGTAQVSLDAQGVPNFTITENAAWDYIQWTNQLIQLAAKVDAVCFGSLAQRSSHSCRSIHEFLHHTRHDCLKIFDINLRQQYYSKDIIKTSLKTANVLKLNDGELVILQDLLELPSSPQEALCALQDSYELDYIALTHGAKGALLKNHLICCDCPGFTTTVVDTIGAGDSYTAVLAFGILHNLPLDQINQMANCVAAYVCSQFGATPAFSDSLISEFKEFDLCERKNTNEY
ncbi:MAG: carbohydrate kinase [Sedimentisphaerales bacterium]|nr:carbohydrate kinase [Sedimentisphaerales bacterium]